MSIDTVERSHAVGDDDGSGDAADWEAWQDQLTNLEGRRGFTLQERDVRFLGGTSLGAFSPDARISIAMPNRYRMPPVLGGLLVDPPNFRY
jgi:hypothetical protein